MEECVDIVDCSHEAEVATETRSFQPRIKDKIDKALADPCNSTASPTKTFVRVKDLDTRTDDKVLWRCASAGRGERRRRRGRGGGSVLGIRKREEEIELSRKVSNLRGELTNTS